MPWDDRRRATVERNPKPFEIGPAQALLRLAMADADAWIRRREPVGDYAGAIGRAVVDDEQRRPGERVEDRRADPDEVVGLVVRRQDNPRTVTAGRCALGNGAVTAGHEG